MKNLKNLLLLLAVLTVQNVFAQINPPAPPPAPPRVVDPVNKMFNELNVEKDIAKKDSIYSAFISKNPKTPAATKDMLLLRIASACLIKGDVDNYNKYINQLTNKAGIAGMLNNVAWDWAVSGTNLSEAERHSKQSLAMVVANNKATTADELKGPAREEYNMYADTYAYILWKESRFDEAVKYQADVYQHTPGSNGEINEHYVLMLNSAGQYAQAQQIAEKSIKDGVTSAIIEDELKKSYIKIKGSDADYAAYWAVIDQNNIAKREKVKKDREIEETKIIGGENSASSIAARERIKNKITGQLIKEPAPLFTLKGLDGKEVSLSSLKGKTVILDFWATWCGPCKMSFPGMQIAQNKYKNNPDIVFLFIDSWQNGDNFLPEVKKFITDNGYSFHVLIDEIGSDKKQAKVLNAYKVDGIPTKFIIDKNGDIRFKYVGYSGSTEEVVNEVTTMIETLNTTGNTNTGVKTTPNK